MTSRERWTVYPLLILALGMGLRSRSSVVQCQELVVSGANGKPVARLHATPSNNGQFALYSAEGIPLVVAGTPEESKAGLLEVYGPNGSPQAVLGASPQGGYAHAWTADRKLLLSFGADVRQLGIFLVDAATGQAASLLPGMRIVPRRQAPPKPSDKEEEKPATPPEKLEKTEAPASDAPADESDNK